MEMFHMLEGHHGTKDANKEPLFLRVYNIILFYFLFYFGYGYLDIQPQDNNSNIYLIWLLIVWFSHIKLYK